MHNRALLEVGLAGWRYQLLPVPPELLAETLTALPGTGFLGVNVTIPHKTAALALAREATPGASAIGAANTLRFTASGAIADNTDAPALIAALPLSPKGTTALVLGAGGSARAAVWALAAAGAAAVHVWNRGSERARALCAELGGVPVSEAGPADLLVNCTPAGLRHPAESFSQLPVREHELHQYGCVVDFAYGGRETGLVAAARAQGIPAVDGLELLVQQGALSFEQFTDRPAPLQAMRAAVRAPLSWRDR